MSWAEQGARGDVRPLFIGRRRVMGYFIIVAFCGACWIAFEGV